MFDASGMSYNRTIGERIRQAEQSEILNSEEQFAADIRRIFDGELGERGVHFEFGSDRDALEKFIAVLGLDKDIQHMTKGGYINYAKALYGSGGAMGSRSHEVTYPIVEQHGVVGALELLQSESWHVESRGALKKHVATIGDTNSSELLFMRVSSDDQVDFNSFGIVVGMTSLMEARLLTEHGYIDEDGLPDVYGTLQRRAGKQSDVAKLFGDYIRSMDEKLQFPSVSFFVRIGKLESGGFLGGVAGVKAYENYFDLKHGRFERDADRSGDNDKDDSEFAYDFSVPVVTDSDDEYYRYSDDFDDDYYDPDEDESDDDNH